MSYSGFLYARPTAAEGVGRILDVGGTLTEFNTSLSDQQADRIALRLDWKAVGADLATLFLQVLDVEIKGAKR